MTPDISFYSDLDPDDPKLWKIRLECKPNWYKLKGRPSASKEDN